MEKIKLDRASTDALRKRIEAGERDLGLLLQDIDITASLPYIIILYKDVSSYVSGEDKLKWYGSLPEELRKLFGQSPEFVKNTGFVMSFNVAHPLVYGKYPVEDMEYFMEVFTQMLQERVIEWGFKFLEHYKMKFEPI